ncbi:MAG TPA: GNAT family N-acetyltransferase [Terriglobales bacterium]|nr:GNAT family N-acetyltransferase [Terriglobales bacterium]
MSGASASPVKPQILVRALRTIEEMRTAVELQRRVWGYSEADVVPDQIFVVARESGGQVLAAYEGETAVGFALAFAGIHVGKPYLHSHMVGVVRDYQDRGVGRLLKLAQREDAMARGIDLIEWTFDPLQLKNAHFNLAKLGAIVRRYIPNVYGRTSSPLHAGLPTDRLVAEWWVNSPHVQSVLEGKRRTATDRSARISIPSNIRQVCAEEPAKAEEIQAAVREEFYAQIAAGRTAMGFEFTGDQGSYLLEPYEDRID